MANTKEVYIEVWVPFDWTSNLTAREAKVFAAWTLGASGLGIDYHGTKMLPVPETGGRLTMHLLTLQGHEAIWPKTLAIMYDALCKQRCAEVVCAEYSDLDDPSGPWAIPTVKQALASERKAKREFERRFGKNGERLKFGKPTPCGKDSE